MPLFTKLWNCLCTGSPPRCPGCWCPCAESDSDEGREVIVYMNDPEANAPMCFPDNFVSTSKYTVFTFIPLGLFHQFLKVSNAYLLINMIIALLPGVSPISPATAIAPLVFLLLMAMTKEGYEDFKRHQVDNQANAVPTEVLRNGVLIKVASRDLRPGDVVKISNGEGIHADVVLLSSAVEEGQAFIETCNLDGETNLKVRKALEGTWHLNSPEAFQQAQGTLHMAPPDPGLLSWAGMLLLNGSESALSLDQFLYRGCVLRNTEYVWGVVAYTGMDTKIFQNLKERPPKFSNLDYKLNILIILIFILQNVLLIIISSLACWWNSSHMSHWYLRHTLVAYSGIRLWFYRYLTYFILLSYLIPVSLFVTTELCKVVQAQWMRLDAEMMEYMGGRWRHCVPNTSSLNEQLAIVRFIFTDKTGTLTENIMEFKRGDVQGFSVDSDNLEMSKAALAPTHPMCNAVKEYFLALALCNTIQPFKDASDPSKIVYEGSSPDEVALVRTAAEHGFHLIERTSRSITLLLDYDGQKRRCVYNILSVLEFTPNRKMMSIALRDVDTGGVKLFTKGADSYIKPRLSSQADVQANMSKAESNLNEMASLGLRTLLMCSREVNQEEFDSWNATFVEAGKALANRSEAVDKVCGEIETNLRLVGVTAIEDKLQDQVPETLSFFLDAGVVIWMLTGDKRETAVTIAATSTLCDPRNDFVDHVDCGHLDPDSQQAVEKIEADLRLVSQHVALKGSNGEKRCTMVIDGPSLEIAMKHHFELFLRLSQEVSSAVCCRLTPLQKANVVHLFQKHTGHTALAIGDGANDVTMIQVSRVGIGVIGLEGAQAALASDYAIPRFKHLRRLCAVHGRYSLFRNSSCILISMYKNFMVTFLQLIFVCSTGFSGTTLITGWLLTFYNVVLTSLPPLFMGIFEKDLPEEVLLAQPKLFSPLARGQFFDYTVFLQWAGEAIFHAVVLYFTAYPTLVKRDTVSNNMAGAMWGTMVFSGMVCVVLGRFILQMSYWQWIELFGILVSAAVSIIFVCAYSVIPSLFGDTSFYWHIIVLAQDVKFWLYILLWIGTLLIIINLSIIYFRRRYFPTMCDMALLDYMMPRRRKPSSFVRIGTSVGE